MIKGLFKETKLENLTKICNFDMEILVQTPTI